MLESELYPGIEYRFTYRSLLISPFQRIRLTVFAVREIDGYDEENAAGFQPVKNPREECWDILNSC